MPKRKNPIFCANCHRIFQGGTNSKYCDSCRFVNKACPVCGKTFRYNRSHEIGTCSGQCREKLHWGDVGAARAARRSSCGYCGKPITRKYISYGKRKPKHLFCNNACYGKWRSENIHGELHPNFRGGYDGYYGPLWRKQRAAARRRDKVCQRCGKTPYRNGKALDVHHIIPFREFGLERAAEAHNIENLICYCASCHMFIEWGDRTTT